MRTTSTTIPWSGARRQAVLDAFRQAFAQDAEYQIRRLIVETDWDLATACDMWRGGLESLINGAVEDGCERLVKRAALAELFDGGTA